MGTTNLCQREQIRIKPRRALAGGIPHTTTPTRYLSDEYHI